MPASVSIKNALTNIESAKKRKNEIMSEVVQDLANLNMVEQLMTVHQGNATKEAVFNEMKTHYTDSFARLNEQQDLIQASNNVIAQTWDDFKKLKQSVQVDPTRTAFFQRIDFSLMCQQDLENMLHQGQNFYSTLVDHLTNLKQGVQDFKMSRNL